MTNLSFRVENSVLLLEGELSEGTLLSVWQQRQALLITIKIVNLSGLTRVDSAGLALLVNFYCNATGPIKFIGMNEQLKELVELYNLHNVLT